MLKILTKYLKVILINFLIFLLLIIIAEIIFGDWFKNNFKFKINTERNINKLYEFKFSNYEGISRYKRDKFGFRIEREIDPSEIDIIFLGGSTINEKFTNYNETIVGLFQEHLIKNKFTEKIANGGIDGMSIIGHINSFDGWFDKIKNFRPKIYIYYIGLNDSFLQMQNLRDVDFLEESSFPKKIKYFIISNSFIIKNYRNFLATLNQKFNLNIGKRKVSNKVYGERDNNKFITWDQQQKIVQKKYFLDTDNSEFKKLYLEKIKILTSLVKKRNGNPIFITQNSGTGLSDRLYIISELIINHCKKENLSCFNLTEELDLNYDDFYDWGHTNPNGSKKVANYIFENMLSKKLISSKN
jgi:hypothetical protein